MINEHKRVILYTGSPGVGKTTLVRAAIPGIKLLGGRGFTTGEIRRGGERLGFSISTLNGREGVLAHANISGGPRLGRYGINLNDIERLMVGEMEIALEERCPLLADEFGAMEMRSANFARLSKEVVNELPLVIGVIREKPHPVCDRLKQCSRVQVIRVSADNREHLREELLEYMGTLHL
jgi:nucleoside-triphosphatase